MNTDKTILEVQSEIETALQHLPELAAQLPDVLKPLVKWLAPPKGSRTQVSLRHRHGRNERQVKRNAPTDSWSPESGLVAISYTPCPSEERGIQVQKLSNSIEEMFDTVMNQEKEADVLEPRVADTRHADPLRKPTHVEDPLQGMVLALAMAERDPQLGFVSLKWFRDTYLPRQGYAWAAVPEDRQRVLVQAIDRKWILTSKVPNPKNPQYPVTAIRVNRPLADVRRILAQEANFGSAFAPITIVGEPLSETVLRERR